MSGSQGKIVAIMGDSGGIGKATALLFTKRDAKVVLGRPRPLQTSTVEPLE